MRCNKCGRELDTLRQMLAQIDPEIGTLCIECYNNSLIEKTKKLKDLIGRFTDPLKGDKLDENKKEDVL